MIKTAKWLCFMVKYPEDAIAQRERLKQERIAAREQRVATVCDDRQEVGVTLDENFGAAVSDCEGFEETEEIGMTM